MKKIYLQSFSENARLRFAFKVLSICVMFILPVFSHAQTTLTFTYTGNTQTFTIPSCVASMTITAIGAGGGTGQSSSNPGYGATAIGVMTGTPGQVLYINVGGQGSLTAGGFNGGGNGGVAATSSGAGGGGASDVRLGTNALSSRILVAAGGGGSGGNGYAGPYNPYGGNGGGGSSFSSATGVGGQAGQSSCGTSNNGGEAGGSAPSYGTGGGGGGYTSGGGGGGQPSSTTGGYGCNGVLGGGGDGGGTGFTCGGATGGQNGGGGGGGGYYGGGGGMTGTGGCNGGGGGGSSYANTTYFSSTSFSTPTSSGHGTITIVYQLSGTSVTITPMTKEICSGSSATLTGSGTSSYTWLPVGSFPGSNSASISVSPTSNTNYTLQGTNSLGCVSTSIAAVTVVTGVPTLTVVNTASVAGGICYGKTATLTASGATTYTWTGGAGTVTNGVSFLPASTATYVVTGGNACGTTTAAASISVTPLLVAASTTSSLVCSGNTATLSAFSGVSGYTWQPGNQPGSTYIVSPVSSTIYTVTASDGTCAGVATVTVNTNPNPTLNVVTTSTNICLGSAVSLTASGGSGTNYTWTSIPATQIITGQSMVSPSFPAAGAYAYYATGDNQFGCTATAMQVIIVNAAPILSATATKTLICSSGATTLNIVGGDTYQWDANANNATTQTTVVNPVQTTTYNVTSTLNATGCSSSTNVVVYIYSPTISISSPTTACLGVAVTLTGNVNNPSSSSQSYTWTGPGVSNVNGTSISVIPNGLSIYTLTAKSITLGSIICTQTITTSVGISPNPTITVAPSRTYVCRGEPVNLVASGAVTYTWNNNTATGTTITVTHTNIATIAYSVVGTDAGGCKNDTVFYLKINGCQGIEEFEANAGITVYPNPNNGSFYVTTIKNVNLKLINELGQVVRTFELSPDKNHMLQVADLMKGIYFLVDDRNTIKAQKIIVDK